MLGRLRMSVADCIKAYLRLSQVVFQPRRQQRDILGRARDRVQLRGRFDGGLLKRVVREVVRESGEDLEASLLDLENKCKV